MSIVRTLGRHPEAAAVRRPAARRHRAARLVAAFGLAAGLVLSGGPVAQAAAPMTARDPYADAYLAKVCAIRGATSLIKVCSQREGRTFYHVKVTRCVASHLIAPVTPSVWSASIFIGKFNYWWVRCWNNNAEGW